MSTTVSFPGLGIDNFSFDRVAVEIFGKPIYWYGVFIMLGILAAFVHAYLRCKQEGIKGDDILDVGLFTVIFISIFLATGNDAFYAPFLIFNTIMRFHASMYLGLITAIVPTGISSGPIDYTEFLIESILFTVIPILSVAVTHLAYYLGSRERKLFSLFTGKR